MFQQLQLIPARLHVDEIDHHDAADVAQLQLTGNLDRRLAIGPEHGFPGIGGAGEGARVDVDDGERLGGLDDHVTARGQLHPRLESVADGGVDLVVLKDLGGLVVGLHLHIDLIGRQIGLDPGDRIRGIDHHPHQLGAVEIAQNAMDEVFVAVEQHRRAGGFSRLLDGLPLTQQRLKIIDQQVFTHTLRLGADQQPGTGRLDQHAQGPQPVAFVFAVDAA